MVSITSLEFKFLVFRYVRESGFTHSAFALGLNSNHSDVDMDNNFSFLQPLDLITEDRMELVKVISTVFHLLEVFILLPIIMADIRYGFLWGSFDMGVRKRRTSMQMKIGPRSVPWLKTMEISPSSTCLPCEIPSCDVKVLEGLTSEVFACAWSPAGSFLASGCHDVHAVWFITNGPCSTMQNGLLNIVLKHFRGRTNEKNKDVTTLDWNGDGTVLATGSYDNQARIWSRVGMLFYTLNKHKGPVFSLKWNKKGDNLLSGSMDKTAIVWGVKTGE
ncbi:unnamed protein product, partial [Vitis vinifera]